MIELLNTLHIVSPLLAILSLHACGTWQNLFTKGNWMPEGVNSFVALAMLAISCDVRVI